MLAPTRSPNAFVLGSFLLSCAGSGEVVLPDQPPPPGLYKLGPTSCYMPPDFSAMGRSAAQSAKVVAFEEAQRRWTGKVDPNFSLTEKQVTELESIYLSRPEDLGPILGEDHRLCQLFAQGKLPLEDYQTQLLSFARSVGKDRCEPNAFVLLSNNILIDKGWQLDVDMCKGQRFQIKAGPGRYSVSYSDQVAPEAVRWITAAGDDQSTDLNGAPCQQRECLPGMLIGRFVDGSGQVTVFPVGMQAVFSAPAHGALSVRINDDTFYNNRFYQEKQVFDFLLVEISPAP